MSYVIVAVVSAAVGFVIGALVYKNNSKKADAVVATAQQVASDIKKV